MSEFCNKLPVANVWDRVCCGEVHVGVKNDTCFFGVTTFLHLKNANCSIKFLTRSKYIDKTETKQKQTPMTHFMVQVL